MKLDFDSMVVANFKTFIGEHSISFQNTGIGLHFLCGSNKRFPKLESNGAGKTSLIDAFRWCLTGVTTDGLKGPEVRPWEKYGVKDQTLVNVTFRTDGKSHQLSRGQGPNHLILDGNPCDQVEVDRLLQLSDDVISYSMIFGQDKPLFFDLEPGEKLALFSTVLDLDRWDARAKKASDWATGLDKEKARTEGEKAGTEREIETFTAQIEECRAKSRTWARDRAEKIKLLREELGTSCEQLKAAETERDEAKLEADGSGVEVKALRISLNALTKKRVDASAAFQVLTYERDRLKKELELLGETDTCPVCKQSVKGTDLAKHKTNLRQKIAVAEKEVAKGKPEFNDPGLAEKLTEFEDKEERAQTTVERLNTRIGDLKGSVTATERLINDTDDQDNPYEDQMKAARLKLDATKAKLDRWEKALVEIAVDQQYAALWAKGFKEVRLLVVEDTLKELELVTNDMLQDVGLDEWQITYSIEAETKKGTVKRGLTVFIGSPYNDKPVRWKAFSGGEKQRLRLIGSLALGEVLLAGAGVTPNVETLDEPSKSMTVGGVRDLCAYLAWRADNLGKTIFLVDHQAVQSSDFTSTITVERDDDGSRIVQ